MEANLSGDDRLVLSVRPSELAGRLKDIPGIATIKLWEFPFQTLRNQLTLGKSARQDEALEFEPFAVRPAIWKARTRHFQGRHQQALGDALDRKDAQSTEGYLSKSVRPTDREIAASSSENKRRIDATAKLDAAYWVGLLSFDDGKYAVAANWLRRPELTAAGSPWASGARYNLARALEAQDQLNEAIVILERDTSPQRQGNKLRARDLKSRLKDEEQREPTK